LSFQNLGDKDVRNYIGDLLDLSRHWHVAKMALQYELGIYPNGDNIDYIAHSFTVKNARSCLAMARYGKKAQESVKRAMHKMKKNKLKSGRFAKP